MGEYRYAWVQRRRRKRLDIRSKQVEIGSDVYIARRKHGLLEFKGRCTIHNKTQICFDYIGGEKPRISFGNNVVIGKGNDFGCACGIIFEDDVLTAPYVHISDRNHGFADVNKPIRVQPIEVKGPVRIGAHTWLGFGVQVMSGVSIGRHCVIGAGAVVVKDIPDYCVAGGNPCKIIKRYNTETDKWEKP